MFTIIASTAHVICASHSTMADTSARFSSRVATAAQVICPTNTAASLRAQFASVCAAAKIVGAANAAGLTSSLRSRVGVAAKIIGAAYIAACAAAKPRTCTADFMLHAYKMRLQMQITVKLKCSHQDAICSLD